MLSTCHMDLMSFIDDNGAVLAPRQQPGIPKCKGMMPNTLWRPWPKMLAVPWENEAPYDRLTNIDHPLWDQFKHLASDYLETPLFEYCELDPYGRENVASSFPILQPWMHTYVNPLIGP